MQLLEHISNAIKVSPTKHGNSPIKQLPFSPSQFLNSPNLSFDVTLASTPMKHHRVINVVNTPIKEEVKVTPQQINIYNFHNVNVVGC